MFIWGRIFVCWLCDPISMTISIFWLQNSFVYVAYFCEATQRCKTWLINEITFFFNMDSFTLHQINCLKKRSFRNKNSYEVCPSYKFRIRYLGYWISDLVLPILAGVAILLDCKAILKVWTSRKVPKWLFVAYSGLWWPIVPK